MDCEKMKVLWKQEEDKLFKGWDFSYLDGRCQSVPLPWDYKEIVLSYLKKHHKLLDLATGGGEFLLGLQHPYDLTYATEAYLPNITLCEEKLVPLGITVKAISGDDNMPFPNHFFDIIIARHEAFSATEMTRLLKDGGFFITQQVGGKNNNDLSTTIIDDFKPPFPDLNLAESIKALKQAGFRIIKEDEVFSPIKFFDIGALVYFAKIIEWEFPDFSVDACFDKLCALQKKLEQDGFVQGTEHRFMIVAQKS